MVKNTLCDTIDVNKSTLHRYLVTPYPLVVYGIYSPNVVQREDGVF